MNLWQKKENAIILTENLSKKLKLPNEPFKIN